MSDDGPQIGNYAPSDHFEETWYMQDADGAWREVPAVPAGGCVMPDWARRAKVVSRPRAEYRHLYAATPPKLTP